MKALFIVFAAVPATVALRLGLLGDHMDSEKQTMEEHSTFGGLSPRQDGRCGINQGKRTCPKGYCCSIEGSVQTQTCLQHTLGLLLTLFSVLRIRWCGEGYDYCSSPACQVDFSDSCDGNIRPSGPDTKHVDRSKHGSVPYGQGVYHCEKYGVIALSYDDGPYEYTADLLNLLKARYHLSTDATHIFTHITCSDPSTNLDKKYKAKATFFITGRNLGKGAINNATFPWRNLIKRMIMEGHQIGSHSWSHQRLPEISDAQLDNQIFYNEIALTDILGYFPTYFRPPYSASSDKVDRRLGELGYHVTYFNLDTEGYLHDSPYEIQKSKDIWDRNVEGKDPKNTKWLDIEHDIVYQSVYNLTEHMLKSLFKNRFKSVTVGECLNDPEQNWYRRV